jgi:glycosyltransferase involved in cell wall biosynthesis
MPDPAAASPQFTVAIRAYNAAERLPALLAALKAQVGVEAIAWEILVVDNCSTDGTAMLLQQYQASWREASHSTNANCTLRYCFEPQQGAVFARQRAMGEARGRWVGFLDDDNLPRADWVAACYAFGCTNPQAGAYGSQIHGVFEVEPPAHFERIAHFLPVIEREQPVCFTQGRYARKKVLPPGAGLVLQRVAWLEAVPAVLHLTGPVGSGLLAKGEDIEALSYIKQAGWEIWFNPAMHVDHCIPRWRFERDYLLRFFRGVGLGRCFTRMFGVPLYLRPVMMLLYCLNDLRRLGLHWLRHGAARQTDLVSACEREMFRASLISSWHYWGENGHGE